MSQFSHSIQRAYQKILRLYPRRFRQEFGDEMIDVFEQVIQDVENHNPWTIMGLFLHEVFDLPKVIIHDIFFTNNRDKGIRAPNRSTILLDDGGLMDSKENKWVLSGKKDILRAVLPPTLFGLGISLTWGIIAGPWHQVSESTRTTAVLVGLIPIAFMAGIGIWGLFKKMPAWSPVWYGVDICGVLLLMQALADNDPTVFNDPLVLTGSILGIVVLLAIAIIIALRGWEQAGLLGIGLSSTICLFHGHTLSAGPINRADIGMLTVLVGCCFSILSYFFIKAEKTWQRVTILAVTAGLNITAVAFTARMYSIEWNEQSFFTPLAILITIALASGFLVQGAKYSFQKLFAK